MAFADQLFSGPDPCLSGHAADEQLGALFGLTVKAMISDAGCPDLLFNSETVISYAFAVRWFRVAKRNSE
jgi:hypothetical protein